MLDQRRNNNVDPKHLVGDFYKLQESQRERERDPLEVRRRPRSTGALWRVEIVRYSIEHVTQLVAQQLTSASGDPVAENEGA